MSQNLPSGQPGEADTYPHSSVFLIQCLGSTCHLGRSSVRLLIWLLSPGKDEPFWAMSLSHVQLLTDHMEQSLGEPFNCSLLKFRPPRVLHSARPWVGRLLALGPDVNHVPGIQLSLPLLHHLYRIGFSSLHGVLPHDFTVMASAPDITSEFQV